MPRGIRKRKTPLRQTQTNLRIKEQLFFKEQYTPQDIGDTAE